MMKYCSSMVECPNHIQSTYKHLWHIMTGGRKIITVQQMVMSWRKVFKALPSSGTEKLIAGILCLIADQTAPLVMMHRHNHEKQPKPHKR